MNQNATSSIPSTANVNQAQDYLNHYELSLRVSGKSHRTVRSYLAAVNDLRRFSSSQGMPDLIALTTEHLREYLNSLYERGNKPSTISLRHMGVRQYYRWLVTEGERKDNPTDRIPLPRVPETIQPHYTPEDIRQVLKQIPATTKNVRLLRDRAILLTFFDTGLRCAELCGLEEEDLDLRGLKFTKVRKAKGGKERPVAIAPTTADAIARYLRRRPKPSRWLFASRYEGSRNNGMMTTDGIRHVMIRLFAAASVEFKGIHAFRRGWAITFLEAGGDPEDVRTLAGWESGQMLRRYTKATEQDRAIKAHRKFSPVDQL